jgi:hypothetical protein
MSIKKRTAKKAKPSESKEQPLTAIKLALPKKEAPRFEIPVNLLDQAMSKELQKILSRVELKLEGTPEIMAANQVMVWVSDLEKRISSKIEEMQRYKKERHEAAMKLLEEKENA